MGNYTIGLTGGVASGKSMVAQCFRDLGVEVIDADIAAREVVAPGTDGLAGIVATFGADVLVADGSLDRAAMRRRIFEDGAARRQLEAIVHPRVRTALRAASETAIGPYVLVAIPLLAEGGGRDGYPWLDRILVVDVPVQVQVARLLERDAVEEALAHRMVDVQAERLARLAIADDVLVNSDTVEALATHVAALDAQYRALAAMSRSSQERL